MDLEGLEKMNQDRVLAYLTDAPTEELPSIFAEIVRRLVSEMGRYDGDIFEDCARAARSLDDAAFGEFAAQIAEYDED